MNSSITFLCNNKPMAKNKERLDKILTDKGFFETKSKAQGAIMAGDVKINDEKDSEKVQYVLEELKNAYNNFCTLSEKWKNELL